MYRSFILALLLFFFWHLTFAGEPPIHYATRGEVLYLTQCINCHSAKEHWKHKNAVTDWKSLKIEVRHRQDMLSLDWSDEDIEDVARYLNDTHYKFTLSGAKY
jgi:mono/diheme cytochrome c family protein